MSEAHSAQNQLEHCITAVKVDRKNNKEYILSFEHIEEPITVHEDMFIKYRLMKGVCLTSSLIAEIIEENGKYMAYIKAIRYLGTKARSTRQIAEYLKRQEFNDEHISHAIERLQSDGYVNDEQYAIAYVQSKTRIQGNGRVKIAQDLKNRGISQKAIQVALSELDEEEEFEAASRIAIKKLRSLSGEDREVRRKLQLFLLRKGYTSGLIRKVMHFVENERKSNMDE